jgi:Flp pilus assembly protein TadD
LGKSDFRTALSEYQKILPIYEEVDGKTKFPTFYAAYAKSLMETGDTLNAKTNFLIAVNEMKSTDPVVYTNLGSIAFMKDKEYAQAEQYYQKALDLGHPDKFGAYSNLGMSQVILKKEAAAAANFEKALEYGSNKPVLGNLYLLYQSLGNPEKANMYRQMLNESK